MARSAGTRYDRFPVGDEASARDLLAEMQSRLGRDPHEALGLVGSPSALDVRNAFLTLTKTFHPAKFARMAPDIQRLANEVFLSLRAAHDNLSRASVSPTRKSGPMPTLQQMRVTQQQPIAPPAVSRAPTGQLPVVPRAPAPPQPSAAQPTQPMRPFANPRPGTGGARTPAPEIDPQRPSRLAQPSPPPGHVRPAPPAAPAQPARPAAPTPTAGGGDRELAPILELIKLGQLSAARIALETLTARSPNIPRYQALLHYARGREAQLAKRVDEARVELQDALQIDPDLALAKTALGELFTRRK
jgi:hypothetical protein